MAALDSLPDELILLICEEVRRFEIGDRTLLRLLRVNKHLHELAQAVFYRDFNCSAEASSQRKLCALMVLNPKLASYVHAIHADVTWSEDFDDKQTALADTKQALGDERVVDQLAARAADIFHDNEEQREEWREGIECQSTKYMVPLMLVHLPDLRELCMGQDYETAFWQNLGTLVDQMHADDRIPKDQKPFTKLKDILIEGVIDKYPVSPEPLAIVARWPAVESIRAIATANEDGEEPTADFTELRPRSLNLMKLELWPESKLLGGNLQGLLGTSRNLRQFKYHIGHAWSWIHFSSREFQKTLSAHKETLEHLTLWLDPSEFDMPDNLDLQEHMDLSAFTRLTHLCIGAPFFFGGPEVTEPPPSSRLTRSLPGSLSSLRIVQISGEEDASAVKSSVKHMFRHLHRFPKFRKLELSCLTDSISKCGALQDLKSEGEPDAIDMTLTRCATSWEEGLIFSSEDLFDRNLEEVEKQEWWGD